MNARLKRVSIWLLGGIILLAIPYALFTAMFTGDGELAQKPRWSLLQGIELAHRDTPSTAAPIVLRHPEGTPYTVLGLPTHDRHTPFVWLILNDTSGLSPRSPLGLYSMPQDKAFHVTCAYVSELASQMEIRPRVLEFLQNNCVAP